MSQLLCFSVVTIRVGFKGYLAVNVRSFPKHMAVQIIHLGGNFRFETGLSFAAIEPIILSLSEDIWIGTTAHRQYKRIGKGNDTVRTIPARFDTPIILHPPYEFYGLSGLQPPHNLSLYCKASIP